MRKQLNKSEIKELNKKITEQYNVENFFSKKDKAEVHEEIIVANNKPVFFYVEEKIVPTLYTLLKKAILKIIVVDMGAVKFVVKGADIMRPGIVKIDLTIKKDEYIVIVDENNKKPIAVGKSLFSGEEMEQLEAGKVIEHVHYVGDEIWKLA